MQSSGDPLLSENAPKLVHTKRICDSSIDPSFNARTKSGAYADYIATCDRPNLKAKAIFAAAGTAFAYPTRTIHMAEAPSLQGKIQAIDPDPRPGAQGSRF